jgi:hypothetical protein
MVMDLVHKLEYIIEFIEPIDYFNVILQKQIDLRIKYKGDVEKIVIVNLDRSSDRLNSSDFMKKHDRDFNNFSYYRVNFLELNNSPDKYSHIKYLYKKIKDDCDKSLEEYEYNFDLMLEEFKLFVDKFEFNSDEKRIIDAFVLDKKIKSNIKFIGWKDYWITV